MTTFTYNPITDSKLVGVCPDGTPLRSWAEGSRTFVEIYVHFTAASGTTYGLVNVLETTAA